MMQNSHSASQSAPKRSWREAWGCWGAELGLDLRANADSLHGTCFLKLLEDQSRVQQNSSHFYVCAIPGDPRKVKILVQRVWSEVGFFVFLTSF